MRALFEHVKSESGVSMKRVISIFGVLLISVIAGAGVYTWAPHEGNPRPEILAAGAENYDVEIVRDNWGVPHIFGTRDVDTVFGMAYAQSEDDFDTIQESVATTRGHMARYRGFEAVTTDYIVHLLDVWPIIEKRYENDVSDDVKALAEAYVAGLNLYAAEHPNKAWPGLYPLTAKDVIAGSIFKTPFFYGLDGQLVPLFGDERVQEIALDPSEGRTAYVPAPRTLGERGSNAMAVAPHRTTDGKTRLLVNSHQPYSGPVAWYEAHLVSDEGLDIMGGTFPGSMLILHGFNKHLGWANTVNNPDLADIYVLTRNPDNPDQYKLDGEWVDFEKRDVEIEIRLFGPFSFTAERTVLFSKHGPVIESPHGTYAVRYAGQGEIRQLEQYYRYNKAKSFEDYTAALEMQALPSINYIYADKSGNIAYIYNGQYPERLEGWDWSKYMPGDRSDLIWDGYKPYSAVPKLINPSSGFIYDANNTPFAATDGPDNLKAEDFSPTMGVQTNETNRSLRFRELIDGETPISEIEFLRIKFDDKYSENSVAASIVRAVLGIDWSNEPEMAEAVAHLSEWDLRTNRENRHAALGVLTTLPAVTAKYTGRPAPTSEIAFRNAVELLKNNHGRIDPEWGDVNRIVRGGVDMPIDGGPDILRAVYPQEIREDGRLHAFAGDTYIASVEWDADGKQSAKIIHQFGSATKDTSSKHYDDQAPLFAKKEWRPALLDRQTILDNAERVYRPGKGAE
jgi:penicillin amidase/acyl-homoserine-lactone acylase